MGTHHLQGCLSLTHGGGGEGGVGEEAESREGIWNQTQLRSASLSEHYLSKPQ